MMFKRKVRMINIHIFLVCLEDIYKNIWKIIKLILNYLYIILYIDNFCWLHEAILLLFKVYADNEYHLTSGKTHKKFWELVSSKLIEKGYDVTGLQCKSKMAGLKNTYKNVKDHNAKSGNNR